MTISNTVKITPELIASHGLKPDEYQRILDLVGRPLRVRTDAWRSRLRKLPVACGFFSEIGSVAAPAVRL